MRQGAEGKGMVAQGFGKIAELCGFYCVSAIHRQPWQAYDVLSCIVSHDLDGKRGQRMEGEARLPVRPGANGQPFGGDQSLTQRISEPWFSWGLQEPWGQWSMNTLSNRSQRKPRRRTG